MKIIEKVEVSYFRSVYSLALTSCQDVNILIGQNDAGKSNILKALNLFFNNETELTSPVDFLEDLSRSRAKEARAAKGKSTIWIKVTFRNRDCKTAGHTQETVVRRVEHGAAQSQYSSQGGASIPEHQAKVWLQQGPLSRLGQEHQSMVLVGCIQQLADE